MLNNDNVSRFSKSNNDNNNVRGFKRALSVEATAMQLVDKLKSPGSYKFYCKVAYVLPERTIWLLYEQAITGKKPGALFNWLCRREMLRRS